MDPDDIARFVELITPVVLEAGEFAMHSQGKVKNIGKEDDENTLPTNSDYVKQVNRAKTVIDEQVQERLLIAIQKAFGTEFVHLDAEEDTPSAKLFTSKDADITLVIDPIDGTLEYINGSPEYSVCVALVSKGKVLVALVYFPMFNTLYLLDTDRKFYICKYESQKIVSKTLVQTPEHVSDGTVYVNHRVLPRAIECLSGKLQVIKDLDRDVDWTQALLKCISGEYNSAVFVKPQIRDILIGAMIESMPNGYAIDFHGNKIQWPDGGRVPEVIFGFGALSDKIKTCLV